MADLRTAAQQALEALEATHYDVGSAEKQRLQTMDAITALRAALAQQTQTPCDIAEDGVCEVIDCCRNRSQILEALEIGYDSAQAEAAQYHAAMEGYRPERHAEMDADVAKIAAAITALRAALAQEEQEPVAWMREGWGTDCGPYVEFYRSDEMGWRDRNGWTPLYTAPPRREWHSLTDADFDSICDNHSTLQGAARAIEAKLKEKNNG